MINKRIVKKAIILLAICSLMGCGLFSMYELFRFTVIMFSHDPSIPPEPITIGDFGDSGSYKIDTSTILESIDSGQSPIFLPETAQILDSNENGKLEWKQSEFMKVVESLFEFQWKEPLSRDWSIHRIVLDRDCEETPVGFDYATFVFHRLAPPNGLYGGRPLYDVRIIEISLPDGIVSWGISQYPRPFLGIGVSEHHLDDVKITAEDALDIAEKNGGKAARQSVQNECDLRIYLDENWRVVYSPSSLFKITIDPYTGWKVLLPLP